MTRLFTIRDEADRARVIRGVQGAALKDKQGRCLQVIVKRRQPRRSLSQNALFHSWCHILAKHTGNTDAEMKRDLKMELLPKHERVNKITGECVMEPLGTSKLDTVTMSEFLDRVQALAAEHFDIVLPSPEDEEAWIALDEAQAE